MMLGNAVVVDYLLLVTPQDFHTYISSEKSEAVATII